MPPPISCNPDTVNDCPDVPVINPCVKVVLVLNPKSYANPLTVLLRVIDPLPDINKEFATKLIGLFHVWDMPWVVSVPPSLKTPGELSVVWKATLLTKLISALAPELL